MSHEGRNDEAPEYCFNCGSIVVNKCDLTQCSDCISKACNSPLSNNRGLRARAKMTRSENARRSRTRIDPDDPHVLRYGLDDDTSGDFSDTNAPRSSPRVRQRKRKIIVLRMPPCFAKSFDQLQSNITVTVPGKRRGSSNTARSAVVNEQISAGPGVHNSSSPPVTEDGTADPQSQPASASATVQSVDRGRSDADIDQDTIDMRRILFNDSLKIQRLTHINNTLERLVNNLRSELQTLQREHGQSTTELCVVRRELDAEKDRVRMLEEELRQRKADSARDTETIRNLQARIDEVKAAMPACGFTLR